MNKSLNILKLKVALKVIGMSSSRYHSWKKREVACQLKDYSSCPKTSPTKITAKETSIIKSLILDKKYSHFPVRALALYASITGKVHCSSSTWYKMIKIYKLKRPRIRVYLTPVTSNHYTSKLAAQV